MAEKHMKATWTTPGLPQEWGIVVSLRDGSQHSYYAAHRRTTPQGGPLKAWGRESLPKRPS